MIGPEDRDTNILPITLAQFLTLLVNKEADVAEAGWLPLESLVHLNMQRRRYKPFLCFKSHQLGSVSIERFDAQRQHTAPRMTCVISMWWSSTMLAK